MYHQPTPINWGNLKFLIMSAPDNENMNRILKDLRSNHVKVLICTCEKHYDETLIKEQGIEFIEMQFNDGQMAPNDIIEKLMEIVD